MTEHEPMKILSSRVNPLPQSFDDNSSLSERQVDKIVSTAPQMNSNSVGSGALSMDTKTSASISVANVSRAPTSSCVPLTMAPFLLHCRIQSPNLGLLSTQFLAGSNVPTLLDTNLLCGVSFDSVPSMAEIRRIIEPRDRSIDSSSVNRTEPKAQLCELDPMSCKLSALGTIASAEVFIQHESSLDAIASAPRALDIPQVHSYLDTNSTANSAAMQTPYCNASKPQGVVRSESAPGALNITVPDAQKTQISTRTLSFLDKYALDNGSLEAYSIATVSSAAVLLSNSTSRRFESMPRASFGPIATTEVLRQPQSSLGLIVSAKGLHHPLSSLDIASR